MRHGQVFDSSVPFEHGDDFVVSGARTQQRELQGRPEIVYATKETARSMQTLAEAARNRFQVCCSTTDGSVLSRLECLETIASELQRRVDREQRRWLHQNEKIDERCRVQGRPSSLEVLVNDTISRNNLLEQSEFYAAGSGPVKGFSAGQPPSGLGLDNALQFSQEDIVGAMWSLRASAACPARRMRGLAATDHHCYSPRVDVELLASAYCVAGRFESGHKIFRY